MRRKGRIMGNCVVCGVESSSECCSGKCRAKKSRRTVEHTERTRTVTAHAAEGVEVLTKDQLYLAIKSYPHDTWVNSPEHKELMRRLHTKTEAELLAEGYWIPSWKHKEKAA